MESETPFIVRRVAKPGSSCSDVPAIISAEWSEMDMSNVSVFTHRVENSVTVKGCTEHLGCKGHHMMDVNKTAFLIPYGFASGDELRYSDGAIMNTAILNGEKDRVDMTDYCMKRIRGKGGILTKQCNGTRPTNSMRFVASPSIGTKGVVYLPHAVFKKGKFLFLTEDSRYETCSIVDGDVVVLGRCPSQGSNSALPMIVRKSDTNHYSMKVPIDLCSLNNLDFDGDECWMYKPMTKDGIIEMEKAWTRIWGRTAYRMIGERLESSVVAMDDSVNIDRAMYTTMPLEDMIEHPGGDIYDILMLKTNSWRVMGNTTFKASYWHTWVERSLSGIVNSTVSKHGIGKPFVDMRRAMMMGTMVIKDGNYIRIRSGCSVPVPAIIAPAGMNDATCSSALTKMTAHMYQEEIDAAKHGRTVDRLTATQTLMKRTEQCFVIADGNRGMCTTMVPVQDAIMSGFPFTKLRYISDAESPTNLLQRAINVVSMVEELDSITLTDEERVAAAVFFAFASKVTDEVISADPVRTMLDMRTDWYTSVTCSNILWIKSVLRDGMADRTINKSTDVTSILGSLFLGNFSKFAPFVSWRTSDPLTIDTNDAVEG